MQIEKIVYGWQEINKLYNRQEQGPTITGKLEKTGRTVNAVRYGLRMQYIDEAGQRWVKLRSLWWRFPQEIEY
jgi:hypothetical protein